MFLLSKYATSHQKNGYREGEGCNSGNIAVRSVRFYFLMF